MSGSGRRAVGMRTSGKRSSRARRGSPGRDLRGRHEEPQPPGDDLGDEADRLQATTMPSVKPDSSTRYSPMTATRRKLETVREIEDGPAVEHGAPCIGGCERRRIVPASACATQARRDEAADDALAIIGLQPVDAAMLVRQPAPDRQQQAGDDVELAVGEGREFRRAPPSQARAKSSLSALLPMGLREPVERDRRAVHRAQQPHAALDAGRHRASGSGPAPARRRGRICC